MVALVCPGEDLRDWQRRPSLDRAPLLDNCLLFAHLEELHYLPRSILLFRPHPHVYSPILRPDLSAKK